jgi:hypothetical protein
VERAVKKVRAARRGQEGRTAQQPHLAQADDGGAEQRAPCAVGDDAVSEERVLVGEGDDLALVDRVGLGPVFGQESGRDPLEAERAGGRRRRQGGDEPACEGESATR